jgi:peptidoglycan hydrolase-like protein with peptidoglycan-binding domain
MKRLFPSFVLLAAAVTLNAASAWPQAEPGGGIRPGGPGTIPEEIQKQPLETRPTEEIKQAQQALKQKGLYRGAIDGVMDTDTRNALMVFQRSQGLSATGSLDDQTKNALKLQFQDDPKREKEAPPALDDKPLQAPDVRPVG